MSEQIGHKFILPEHIPVYIGRQDFVVEYATGKDVLHLGCVDEGLIEQKQQRGLWLHERIYQVANSLWGIDIDKKGIDRMRAQGYPNLFVADIENLNTVPEIFQQEFTLIVLTEVLEHLNNPGIFLRNLKPVFKPITEMLVTVPNATSLANILENMSGRELVHPDHNYWFSFHTIQSLLTKFGFTISWVGVYSQHNYHRSILGHLWKRTLHLLGIRSINTDQSLHTNDRRSIHNERKPNLKGWLYATLTTISYRLLVTRKPFFADGLILLVKPVAQDHNENEKGIDQAI